MSAEISWIAVNAGLRGTCKPMIVNTRLRGKLCLLIKTEQSSRVSGISFCIELNSKELFAQLAR